MQVVSLDDNNISSWSEVVAALGALPSLRVLNLSQNPLPSLALPGSPAAPSEAFPALRALYLASCQLASWRDVGRLNRLRSLSDLRLTGNPLLANAKGGGRYEVGPTLCWSLYSTKYVEPTHVE